jgi:amidase
VVPFAHANDGGGSIRIPAACCGLVGLKPSRSRIDADGSNLLPINIAVNGVVTRTVRDQISFYEAIESRRSPKRVPSIASRRDAKGRLRIGMFHDAPIGTPVDADVRAAVQAAGRTCESLGHDVEAIAAPFARGVLDDFLAFWGFVAWIQVASARVMLHRRFDSSRCEPWTHGIARTFSKRPRALLDAIVRLRAFANDYARIMESYDVLLSPVCAAPAPPLGWLATDLPFETLFDRLRAWCPFTPFHNAVGAPAIALPLGKSASGLPIGVQLAGARGADGMLLDLAAAIELAQPWDAFAPLATGARGTGGRAAKATGET